MTPQDLPPLPEPYHGFYAAPMYSPDQMRAYAHARWNEGYKHGLWQGQNCAQPVPDAKDSMLAFEAWLAGYVSPHSTYKQMLRDAYAAGMSNPAAHPQPAPLTEAAILRIVQRTIHGTTLRLTRDVGPYEVTEPTHDLCMLVRAIEAAHGIVPAPTTDKEQQR